MDWKSLLTSEIEHAYRAAEGLMSLAEGLDLEWKPETGENWMNNGQLLKHLTEACGKACRGFATGDWGLPEGSAPSDMPEEAMLPPAEALPTVDSVREAREALAEDKELALRTVSENADRLDEPTPAPWDPTPRSLGQQMLGMVNHLNNHKAQLFYYLKLQGKPVNTMHFYGMV